MFNISLGLTYLNGSVMRGLLVRQWRTSNPFNHLSFLLSFPYMFEAEEDKLKPNLSKLLIVVIIVCLLILSIVYLNRRWSRIRDVKRHVDLQLITKALQFYYQQYDKFPEVEDDDGEGWDKSNDEVNRSFLEPLIESGLLSARPFDPKNDEEHYYRYQRFKRGDFGCQRAFAVFQITQFETEVQNHGSGKCPDIVWTELAPNGYTWFSLE